MDIKTRALFHAVETKTMRRKRGSAVMMARAIVCR